MIKLIEQLEKCGSLSAAEYELLVENFAKVASVAAEKAVAKRKEVYGNKVYIRGLIEIGNYCRNDCLYCGIRKSNKSCERYRLQKDQILSCCHRGYDLGFRTFVMQGGEDVFFDDDVVCDIIAEIKKNYPDCAVTLSLGEKSRESYQRLFDAGADRYLLRHETADKAHYEKLHPSEISFENRMRCLRDLKDIGFQTGCGFMVGSPFQTSATIAKDLKFIEEFQPQMCGIGPFIPHRATAFSNMPRGSAELTCFLLSVVRLIKPNILLPATTALATASENGTVKGVLSGANIVMPNLSPSDVRKKYELYNGKVSVGTEAADRVKELCSQMESIGYEVVTDRGDIKASR